MDVEASEAAVEGLNLPEASTVTSYLGNQLPHDLHPSYQGISQQVIQKSRPALPSTFHSAPTPASLNVAANQNREGIVSATFSPDEIYREANNESIRFQDLLKDYEKTSAAKHKTGINLDGLHSWEEVLIQVDNAARSYKDPSSLWSKVRRGMKKFGENHQAFDAWMNLLPTQSQYCSIICGALKLVINAAARFKDVRESIFDALAEIPVQLKNTKLVLKVFEKSQELHQCSSELYLSTLATLQHIVLWFQEKSTSKFRSLCTCADSSLNRPRKAF